jgi:hypothetical protein
MIKKVQNAAVVTEEPSGESSPAPRPAPATEVPRYVLGHRKAFRKVFFVRIVLLK